MAKTADERKILLAEHKYFETERLILRAVKVSDAAELFEYQSDRGLAALSGFKVIENLEQEKLAIISFFAQPGNYALELKKTGKVIGDIGFQLLGDKAEFGWSLNRQFWGEGLMPEAAKCLQDFVFNGLELALMTANCFAGNEQSARVMEKLGLKKLGQIYLPDETDEHYRLGDYFALTKEEFLEKGY